VTEFKLSAKFKDGTEEFLYENFGVLVMDDDFFDYLEDETDYMGDAIDIGLFALYVIAWEKSLK